MFKVFEPNVLSGLKLNQSNPRGRINHGTVLLAWFCTPPKNSSRVLELGCGSGAISIYLAKTYGLRVTGVEPDSELLQIALSNASANGVQSVTIFENSSVEDFYRANKGVVYDLVVANPPHYLHPGVRSPNDKRNLARRMNPERLSGFVEAAGGLLKNRGAFCFLLHPRDLTKWIRAMEDAKLGVHRLRLAFGRAEKQAQLVLLSGRKGSSSELIVEPPIWLR